MKPLSNHFCMSRSRFFLIKTSLSPQQVLQQSFCSNTPQLTYPYCYQIVIVALYNSLLKSKPKTLHSTGDSL